MTQRSLALCLVLLVACGPAAGTAYPSEPPPDASVEPAQPASVPRAVEMKWQSAELRDHPLVGAVLRVDGGELVDESVLLEALASSDHVLLGETHDNADHHLLQARYLEATAEGRALVAWEMIERELDKERADALASATSTAQVEAALDWANSGWPDFAIYEPVFAAALEAKLPLRGGGLTRADLAPLFSGGEVDPQLSRDFGLDEALDPALEKLWIDELFDAHCGAMPRDALGPMLTAQRLRDAAMAQAMSGGERTVLIAGSGHVRRDRAVPAMLARSGQTTVAVAFIEVQAGSEDIGAYGELPYDYVVFTPRTKRGDPCEAFTKGKGGKANP